MADTARTRSTLLSTYFPDNVTGQIDAQDLRDGLVTWMPVEFENPMDFWKEPDYGQLDGSVISDDQDYRGWVDYSQVMSQVVSFGALVVRTNSMTWHLGDHTYVNSCRVWGLACSEYAVGESQAKILRRGLIRNTGFSNAAGTWFQSGADPLQGKPLWVCSVTSAGEVNVSGSPPNVAGSMVVGYVETSAWIRQVYDGTSCDFYTMYFDPQWGVLAE